MKKIKFGTDGWRGIIADDFTFENVRLVSQAVANYVNKLSVGSQGIVVGYDNRFLSKQFANTVTEVMLRNGIKVYLPDTSLPTPVTAFAVKTKNAAGAVMLTASHNPPEYNGFKFIPDYAGPASPQITEAIEKNIALLQQGSKDQLPVPETVAEVERIFIDPKPEYFEHIRQLVDSETIASSGLHIMVNAMCGSGVGYLDVLLEDVGVRVERRRCYRDPLFDGVLPEPTAETLADSCLWVSSADGRFGLALDGDADRFGIIDAGGVFVEPNQFLPLLYDHLLTKKGLKGPVTRTVATTHLLDRIAEKHGQQVYETPVGFKFIAQNMLEKGCILGGEESGGLSIRGHIPEKDGILAGLLAAEIVAVHGKSLRQLSEETAKTYGGQLYSKRFDIHTSEEQKQRVLEKLERFNPANIAGTTVKERVTLDGVKLVLDTSEWVLVRVSGTEPLFRVYVESLRPERINELGQATAREIGLV